jgi:hypothetical protein
MLRRLEMQSLSPLHKSHAQSAEEDLTTPARKRRVRQNRAGSDSEVAPLRN